MFLAMVPKKIESILILIPTKNDLILQGMRKGATVIIIQSIHLPLPEIYHLKMILPKLKNLKLGNCGAPNQKKKEKLPNVEKREVKNLISCK